MTFTQTKYQLTSEQRLACDLIRGGKSVFITGKAGTGKTYALNEALEGLDVVRLAPTGAAASLIGGSTIHKFFGLAPGILIPGRKSAGNNAPAIARARTIVIDEISMVRVDMLTSMEELCRLADPMGRPWGGKQIIVTGDFSQLPPVVVDRDREHLDRIFDGRVFSFESEAWSKANFQPVVLTIPQRQNDLTFISALNAVREGLDSSPGALTSALKTINGRIKPLAGSSASDLVLTTRNDLADKINIERLEKIPGRPFYLRSQQTENLPKEDRTLPEIIQLKVGATVLMAANGDGYSNGSRGVVRSVNSHTGEVGVLLESGRNVIVGPRKWDAFSYVHNQELDILKKVVTGTFTQTPVRLGFAITVHRSQGMSLDRVHIDATSWFDHGQAYVALSRAKSLEGLTIERALFERNIKVDSVVAQFNRLLSVPDRESMAMLGGHLIRSNLRTLRDGGCIESKVSVSVPLGHESLVRQFADALRDGKTPEQWIAESVEASHRSMGEKIDLALQDAPSLGQFFGRLKDTGISVLPGMRKDQISGLRFHAAHNSFSGSELGEKYKWGKIKTRLDLSDSCDMQTALRAIALAAPQKPRTLSNVA